MVMPVEPPGRRPVEAAKLLDLRLHNVFERTGQQRIKNRLREAMSVQVSSNFLLTFQ